MEDEIKNIKDFDITLSDGRVITYHYLIKNADSIDLSEEDQKIVTNIAGRGWGWEAGMFKTDKRTHESEYLFDAKKILGTKSAFDDYDKLFGKLNKESKVIEFGCNLARNLREAKERYDCFAVGVDSNPEVISKNSKHFGDSGAFHLANLSDGGEFLKKFQDNEFDLGITCGFLLHIPANERKKNLIKEMTRICKTMWFSEYERTGVLQTEYSDRGGCTTAESLTIYDERISPTDNQMQPNIQTLYFFKK